MTKPWNQAAWRQNTYRVSERKMHGPMPGGPDEKYPQPVTAPRGWDVVETSVDDAPDYREHGAFEWDIVMPGAVRTAVATTQSCAAILTLPDLARLPVGTRVVVVDPGGRCIVAGASLTLELVNTHCAMFVTSPGGPQWTVGFEAGHRVTFRLAEDKPALLTLEEAAAASAKSSAVFSSRNQATCGSRHPTRPRLAKPVS